MIMKQTWSYPCFEQGLVQMAFWDTSNVNYFKISFNEVEK